jgi:S1-C subfamily serine protease
VSTSSSRSNLGSRGRLAWILGFVCIIGVGRAIADPGGSAFDRILQQAGPGIVRIEVRRPWSSVLPDSLRPALPGPAIIRVVGNGLLWDSRGTVVTACDLAQPGDSIQVILDGSARRPADFVGQDAETGLSVVRLRGAASGGPSPRGDPFVALHENSWVFTIGAIGRGSSRQLTLSRIHNRVHSGEVWRVRLEGSGDVGLAGAGVLDPDGRLVGMLLGEGIESAIIPSGAPGVPLEYALDTEGPTEAGWVMPMDMVDRTVRFLLDRRSGQGFLGVQVEVPPAVPSEQTAAGSGLRVARVLPESPASRSGIRAGDRIESFGGQLVQSWDQLTQMVAASPPEQPVQVELLRDGRTLSTTVFLADRGSMVWRAKQLALAEGRERRLIRRIESLNQQLRLFRDELRRSP